MSWGTSLRCAWQLEHAPYLCCVFEVYILDESSLSITLHMRKEVFLVFLINTLRKMEREF